MTRHLGDKGDRGESLVEVLFAISIVAVAFVALLSGVIVLVKASSMDARKIQSQAILKSWAESVATAAYTPCATSTSYPLPSVPAGFTPSIVAVKYWSGSSFVSTCPNADAGTQQLRLRVTVAAAQYPTFQDNLTVLVRRKCLLWSDC